VINLKTVKLETLDGLEDVKSFYAISESGLILNLKSGHPLSPSGARYLGSVVMLKNGGRKTVYVHRLLAMAFIPNPHNKPCVNHIDEDKHNNSLSNLEWVTQKENVNHGTSLARQSLIQRNQKSTSKKVMKTLVDSGEQIIYPSMSEARRAGHDHRMIRRCILGQRKTHKKGTWSLVD
jgi:hypothetical protein